MMAIGRPRTCDCGECDKCQNRDRNRERWQRLSPEKRAEIIAARDPEKRRANDRARYYRNREKRLALAAKWRAENPDESARILAAWRQRNPLKATAQWAVSNAKRDGKLIPQPCEECGLSPDLRDDKNRRFVQAHHDDYSKPLEVRWLCRPCHTAEHRKVA